MDALSSNDIRIGDVVLADEEARERRNIANARWLIDHDGATLPVTNIFIEDEEIFDSPILATRCVAFDSRLTSGNWVCITNLEPGDIWSKVPCPSQPSR